MTLKISNFCLHYQETSIAKFLKLYRQLLPNETTTVKMHILEDHVVECMKKYGVGLGFMSEQGKL